METQALHTNTTVVIAKFLYEHIFIWFGCPLTILSLDIPIAMYIIHKEIIKLNLLTRVKLEPYSLNYIMKIGTTRMNTYP
jgi:hypothetical protein